MTEESIKAFLVEYIALCDKHNLCIDSDDCNSPIVTQYDKESAMYGGISGGCHYCCGEWYVEYDDGYGIPIYAIAHPIGAPVDEDADINPEALEVIELDDGEETK